MNVGELRAAMADYDDESPVFIDSDPWPLEIVEVDNLLMVQNTGPAVRALALVAEQDED